MDYNTLGDFILRIAALIGALGVIFGVIFAVHKWYLRQNSKQQEQDADIARIKAENCLICYGLSACLDGLCSSARITAYRTRKRSSTNT